MNFQPVSILSPYVSFNLTWRKFLMRTNVHMNYLMIFFTGVSVNFSSAKIVLLAITYLKFNDVKSFILWYCKVTHIPFDVLEVNFFVFSFSRPYKVERLRPSHFQVYKRRIFVLNRWRHSGRHLFSNAMNWGNCIK